MHFILEQVHLQFAEKMSSSAWAMDGVLLRAKFVMAAWTAKTALMKIQTCAVSVKFDIICK